MASVADSAAPKRRRATRKVSEPNLEITSEQKVADEQETVGLSAYETSESTLETEVSAKKTKARSARSTSSSRTSATKKRTARKSDKQTDVAESNLGSGKELEAEVGIAYTDPADSETNNIISSEKVEDNNIADSEASILNSEDISEIEGKKTRTRTRKTTGSAARSAKGGRKRTTQQPKNQETEPNTSESGSDTSDVQVDADIADNRDQTRVNKSGEKPSDTQIINGHDSASVPAFASPGISVGGTGIDTAYPASMFLEPKVGETNSETQDSAVSELTGTVLFQEPSIPETYDTALEPNNSRSAGRNNKTAEKKKTSKTDKSGNKNTKRSGGKAGARARNASQNKEDLDVDSFKTEKTFTDSQDKGKDTNSAQDSSIHNANKEQKRADKSDEDLSNDRIDTDTVDIKAESFRVADLEAEEQEETYSSKRKRKRGSRGRRRGSEVVDENEDTALNADSLDSEQDSLEYQDADEEIFDGSSSRRRRRRNRQDRAAVGTDEVSRVRGSTRLEANRQRRRERRESRRKRHSILESEFLARRENVFRQMLVREQDGLNQIAVLEDGMLVEHYVARHTQTTMVGNVYLGRVQNVLPSMEAAFVDIGKGRNAVLYAGEVNWDAAGLEGKPQRIEQAINVGDKVLVQVTKDPIGHKGARLTSQITIAGRHIVLVPSGEITGISRKIPERERIRLKRLLKRIVPPGIGVIVRTAAEGASEDQLEQDVRRLLTRWEDINSKVSKAKQVPVILKSEPELALRVVRDQFNEDFNELIISGKNAWESISEYINEVSPDLQPKLQHWTSKKDIFAQHRVDEQLSKGMDRKVWLPSGGSLIIDRTEAMTVIDVNTGRFTGEGGTLEETVTINNIEAAEEIVRQIRLRDIGGIIVIDFIDMVLEANREIVLRRLVECLGRDRTRHQVAEVTSIGLIQMTRKRVGQGLVEAFSTPCETCEGRGFITHAHPVERNDGFGDSDVYRVNRVENNTRQISRKVNHVPAISESNTETAAERAARETVRSTLAAIAAAAEKAHQQQDEVEETSVHVERSVVENSTESRTSKINKADLASSLVAEDLAQVESLSQGSSSPGRSRRIINIAGGKPSRKITERISELEDNLPSANMQTLTIEENKDRKEEEGTATNVESPSQNDVNLGVRSRRSRIGIRRRATREQGAYYASDPQYTSDSQEDASSKADDRFAHNSLQTVNNHESELKQDSQTDRLAESVSEETREVQIVEQVILEERHAQSSPPRRRSRRVVTTGVVTPGVSPETI